MSILMPQRGYPLAAASSLQRHSADTRSSSNASAKPDEDWTKIDDAVERRRVQNRIAQRNYRKRLKQRLEDPERRAGSSDDVESDKQPQKITKPKRSPYSKSQKSQLSISDKLDTCPGRFTPPMGPTDALFPSGTYDDCVCSGSPSQFIYSICPAPERNPLAPYASTQCDPIMTTADVYPNYLAASTVPMTLPSETHFSDAIVWETYPADDGLVSNMTYGCMPPMSFNAPSPYDQINPHTRNSPDYSANGSEAWYDYSLTPISMSNSPDSIQSPREIKDYIYDTRLNPAKGRRPSHGLPPITIMVKGNQWNTVKEVGGTEAALE